MPMETLAMPLSLWYIVRAATLQGALAVITGEGKMLRRF